MHLLVRYGEIGVKSAPVRRKFEDRLMDNLERKLEWRGVEADIYESEGRILAEVAEEDAADSSMYLSRVPGVVSVSPVLASEGVEMDDIVEAVLELVEDMETDSFAVDASRAGEHGFTSEDIEEEVGQAVVEEKGWNVDLENPGLTVHVEVRYTTAYLYTEVVDGVGGLPVSEEDRVAVLLEDRASTYAAFLLMKRGCRVFPVYAGGESGDVEDEMEILRQFDPDVKLTVMDREGENAVEEAARLYGCDAVAFGDTAEDIDNAPERNVEREVLLPNCGLPEKEVMDGYRGLIPANP
ncbi:MAG: THUMP domain-containing protein [Candidatus Nanohaloarchaea archaeon]